MSNRLLNKWSFVVLLAVAGLALVPFPVLSQEEEGGVPSQDEESGVPSQEEDMSPPSPVQIDLDSLREPDLLKALEAELDDIYERYSPDQDYPISDLRAAILEALSDSGDEDDPNEQKITAANLAQEMREADTTLDAVVKEALDEADSIASAQRSPTRAFARVNSSRYLPSSEFLRLAVGAIARRDGRTNSQFAVQQTKAVLVPTIKNR